MVDRDVAIVTPSYAEDLERCRLLCDSIDAHVLGAAKHYILVADHDAPLFSQFEGVRREVVRESDILPERFLCVPTPGGRRVWLSAFALPLRGWHVQQLRRIAIVGRTRHAGYLYCDSDMAFVRPYDVAELWHGDAFRLYQRPEGVHANLPDGGREHLAWTRHAHRLIGLPEAEFPADDYINNLISWKRDTVLAMLTRIERTTGRPWLRAVTQQRSFSECQIYGTFASTTSDVWNDPTPLCRTFWDGAAMDEAALEAFVRELAPTQVAVGIQSFTGSDPQALRRVLGL